MVNSTTKNKDNQNTARGFVHWHVEPDADDKIHWHPSHPHEFREIKLENAKYLHDLSRQDRGNVDAIVHDLQPKGMVYIDSAALYKSARDGLHQLSTIELALITDEMEFQKFRGYMHTLSPGSFLHAGKSNFSVHQGDLNKYQSLDENAFYDRFVLITAKYKPQTVASIEDLMDNVARLILSPKPIGIALHTHAQYQKA